MPVHCNGGHLYMHWLLFSNAIKIQLNNHNKYQSLPFRTTKFWPNVTVNQNRQILSWYYRIWWCTMVYIEDMMMPFLAVFRLLGHRGASKQRFIAGLNYSFCKHGALDHVNSKNGRYKSAKVLTDQPAERHKWPAEDSRNSNLQKNVADITTSNW